jgi:Fur family transcriptional regulator, ferric uptake regulator
VHPGRQAGPPEASELLAAKGLRVTRQRRQVLEALAGERDDATAQQIHARLRDRGQAIGLATVYRTLALLGELGVVDSLAHTPGELCYRLCSDGHHHHLVCSSCHRVVELVDCEIDSWLDDVASDHGFVATGHQLEVTGVCAACRGYERSSRRRAKSRKRERASSSGPRGSSSP